MATLIKKRSLALIAFAVLAVIAGCIPPASNTPLPFAFTPATDAEPGEVVTSNAVTISGISQPVGATVTAGGTLLVGGAVQGSATQVSDGDSLAVRVTASDDPGATVTVTVTVGGREADFSVTTAEVVTSAVTLDTVPGGLTQAAPGEQITLTWTVDAAHDELVLTTVPATTATTITDPEFTVTIPEGLPQIEYVLTASFVGSIPDASASVVLDVPLWVCQNPGDVIFFADPALRANYDEFFDADPSDDLTCADALAVTAWNTGHSEGAVGAIESLVGMQHFQNLVEFNAHWNLISDLTPVAGLPNLEQLNLDKNQITDLSPLAGHPSLRILEVWDNGPERDERTDGISDISALATIPTLEQLFLSQNDISDLSPLAGLTSVNVIYLIANDIEDISPLAGMTGLQVLRLSGNRITDASVLANMPAMGWLELNYNFLQDPALVPLEGFENLWVVLLEGNFFTSFDPLIDNLDFPAAGPVPGLPAHRGQPTEATVHIAYNCLTEAEDIAAGLAFEAKGLVVDAPRVVRDATECDEFINGAGEFDALRLQEEAIKLLREQGRIR